MLTGSPYTNAPASGICSTRIKKNPGWRNEKRGTQRYKFPSWIIMLNSFLFFHRGGGGDMLI